MESNNTTINDKIDYGLALFGSQDIKTTSHEDTKEPRIEEPKKSRTNVVKNERSKAKKKSRSNEVRNSRLAVNIIMVDDTVMTLKTKAIKMGVKSWTLIDDALQEYLKNYTAQSKEVRKSRHQEIKNSGKKRHPANITLVVETKMAIWLLALREKVSPWVLVEDALSLFLFNKKPRNQEVR